MCVTLSGIITDVKFKQPEKALLPMLVTPLGIVIAVKLEHPLNKLLFKIVILLDKFTDTKLVQL